MHVTSLGLRTDLMVRRLAGSMIENRGDRLVVRTPGNPTFYWGNFLVLSSPLVPGQAGTYESAFAVEFPDARHRAYAVDGTGGQAGDAGELAALGVEVDVSTVLTVEAAALPEPPVRGRALSDDADWSQLVTLRQAGDTSPVAGGQRPFHERKVTEARGLTQAARGAWFGAFVDGRLVSGLGIVSDRGGVARYQDVDTHPDHRRRGLARALLHQAGRHAAEVLGAHTLVIVADPGYHAIDLYRSVGFRDLEQQVQLLRCPS